MPQDKKCTRQGSNLGPSACQADVITTTPRVLAERGLYYTYYCIHSFFTFLINSKFLLNGSFFYYPPPCPFFFHTFLFTECKYIEILEIVCVFRRSYSIPEKSRYRSKWLRNQALFISPRIFLSPVQTSQTVARGHKHPNLLLQHFGNPIIKCRYSIITRNRNFRYDFGQSGI